MTNENRESRSGDQWYQGFYETTVAGLDYRYSMYKDYKAPIVSNANGFDSRTAYEGERSVDNSNIDVKNLKFGVVVYTHNTGTYEQFGVDELLKTYESEPFQFAHATVSGICVSTPCPFNTADAEEIKKVGYGFLNKLSNLGAKIAPFVLLTILFLETANVKHHLDVFSDPEYYAVSESNELDPHTESSANGTSGLSRET